MSPRKHSPRRRTRRVRRSSSIPLPLTAFPAAAQCAMQQLKDSWLNLNSVERGERLHTLVGAGISRRSLANFLECDDALVRWLLRMDGLPDEDRSAVAAGRSPKCALRAAAARHRLELDAKAAAAEDQNGASSAMVAAKLALFARNHLGGMHCIAHITRIFEEAEKAVYFALQDAVGCKLRRSFSPAFPLSSLIATTRPFPEPEYWMQTAIEWLATLAWNLEPNPRILLAAFGKAKNLLISLVLNPKLIAKTAGMQEYVQLLLCPAM
jgi:hypothetical protein